MNFQTRLAEIILSIPGAVVATPRPDYKTVHASASQAQQQITELFLEIIGEDEELEYPGEVSEFNDPILFRNALREKTRKAIND